MTSLSCLPTTILFCFVAIEVMVINAVRISHNVVKNTKFQHRLNFRNLMGLNARQARRDVLILWFLLRNCCFAIDRMLSGAYVLTINRAMIAGGFGDDKDGCGAFLARIFRSDKHGLPNRAP
ncbi:hypothetical protein [Thalassospira lucentensis]|uniref:hypothetical protein n=1 Tax=Thalassospira lucentensis TaxID=168935 RepID=UPI00399D7555